MNIVLKKIIGGGLLLTQTLLLAQEDLDAINQLYIEYGYNLPLSLSLSPEDLSSNVNTCLASESETQQFYCVVGVVLNVSKEGLPSVEDMKSIDIEQYNSFVPKIVTEVQKYDQYIATQKQQREYEKQDKLARANYSSNFFIGIHSENISENGFHIGYASSLDDIRYSLYYTKHSFQDYGVDIGASEIGVNILYPFSSLRFNNVYPHIAVGSGYIDVAETGYDGGSDIYCDVGFDYNFNESFEININARVFDAISLLTYSSVGGNVSLNYWF